MATTSKTTQTCDLCHAETPPGDLRKLGLVKIPDGNQPEKIELDGPPADVCPECRSNREIAKLVTHLETSRTKDLFRRGRELGREENG
jgi:hypothetical protein